MKELNGVILSSVTGGDTLPNNTTYRGPSEASIAAILALFSHPIPTHLSD